MSDLRVAVVVQARASSTRLPGKVLLPLAGEPGLVRMMERVARVTRADHQVVATSDHESDDELAEICRSRGFAVSRGSLDDVLARVTAAVPAECEAVIRLTGDCPLVDPELVDHHVEVFARERPWVEYVTNTGFRTQPDGLDVEVVARGLLEEANRRADSAADREHVTPWIRRRARTVPVTQEVDLSRLRWTLDTAEDYAFLTEVYRLLFTENPAFGRHDVYRLLVRRPDLIHVGSGESLTAEARGRFGERIAAQLATEWP